MDQTWVTVIVGFVGALGTLLAGYGGLLRARRETQRAASMGVFGEALHIIEEYKETIKQKNAEIETLNDQVAQLRAELALVRTSVTKLEIVNGRYVQELARAWNVPISAALFRLSNELGPNDPNKGGTT